MSDNKEEKKGKCGECSRCRCGKPFNDAVTDKTAEKPPVKKEDQPEPPAP